MKDYIYQFYNEGLGYIFIQIPQKYINRNIKNKNISRLLMWIIKGLYTLLAIALIIFIIYKKWPF